MQEPGVIWAHDPGRKRNRPQPQAEKKAFGKDMRWEGKKEVVTDGEEEKKELGFGDLCRSYHRSLRTERDDYTAHNIATGMIEMWKRARYLYADLEEMYLVNMQQHQDKELLARELSSTLSEDGAGLPEGVSCANLVTLTINFFNTEPTVKEKLQKYTEKMEEAMREQQQRVKRSRNVDMIKEEVEMRPSKRKMSKFDSLKPISNYLETLMVSHGIGQSRADLLVLDITERFVTAGFGWDKVLQYHGKGEDVFIKKLIPHVFMSKDEFPLSLTSEMVLHQTYEFMDEWKRRLYDMLSFNTVQKPTPAVSLPVENVVIKQEKMDVDETAVVPASVFSPDVKPFSRKKEETHLHISDTTSHSSIQHKTVGSMEKNVGPLSMKSTNSGTHTDTTKCSTGKPAQRTVLLKRGIPPQGTKTWPGGEAQSRQSPPRSGQDKWTEDSYYVKPRGPPPDQRGSLPDLRGPPPDFRSPPPDHRGPPPDQRKSIFQGEGGHDKRTLQNRGRGRGRGRGTAPPPPWGGRSGRDIDARTETVPKSYYSKVGLSQAEGYLSVEDTDGKTTFYHYTKEEEEERKLKRESESAKQRSKSKDSNASTEEKHPKGKVVPTEKQDQDDSEKGAKIQSRTLSRESRDSESGSEKETKKMTLLEKVNEIIKSCVKMKEEKKMSSVALDKTNQIIHKAQEKEKKLKAKMKNSKDKDRILDKGIEEGYDEFHIVDKALEEGELKDSESEQAVAEEDETLVIGNKSSQRTVTIFNCKDKNVTKEKEEIAKPKKASSPSPERKVHKSRSRSRSRRQSLPKSRSRSISRERSRSRGRQAKSGSRSPSYNRRGGRGGCYNRRSSRSRSPPRAQRDRGRNNWIAVAPCTLDESITLQPGKVIRVKVAPKGEFSFKENQGCMVRVTKWTGRDSINNVKIKPQLVTVGSLPSMEIEIEGEGHVGRVDKIACLSVLSAQIPSALFTSAASRRLDWCDRTQNSDRRWFRVTTVVLHKKGTLGRITIHPGRTMKVIATVTGPLKKYVGKEVLVSQITGVRDYPIEPQISKICENECIGFNVTNYGSETLIIEKAGQGVACLSLWATVRSDEQPYKLLY